MAATRLPALTPRAPTGRSGQQGAESVKEHRPVGLGTVAFRIGGEVFRLPRPLLKIHSPHWAARLAAEPGLCDADLPGEASSFRAFERILLGAEGAAGEITAENVMNVLHWGQEFGMDHIVAACESFLLTCKESLFPALELLEVAARYDMPLLYAKAVERAAQGTHHLVIPEARSQVGEQQAASLLSSENLRGDVIAAHVSMALMRGDGEMRRRHRYADHTSLDDATQRARLLWKSRQRFVRAPPEPPGHDWRTLQTVWPHHSFRGADWLAAPCETQPSRSRFTPRTARLG
eukprot:CAMPEP_0115174576 /NCGR_PEP_ID=MMETSP0270-20121206/3909_1 /TAXON_ID=71861 /ORGANISM="Scrippsiella trochoidea, Strain CCMP3099" /LENGTH=290 /DNA_ID=CAMNT_0002587417 /DNA_START=42 /DNA_END=911 /DNA_ORIENTATION=-